MNAARSFFDTNVLLYVYSDTDPGKQARASAQAAGRGLQRSGNSADLAASRESVVRELLESA